MNTKLQATLVEGKLRREVASIEMEASLLSSLFLMNLMERIEKDIKMMKNKNPK